MPAIEPFAKATAKELRSRTEATPCWYIDDRIVKEVCELNGRAIDHFVAPMHPKGLNDSLVFEASALQAIGA